MTTGDEPVKPASAAEASLSARGRACLKPPPPYLLAAMQAWDDQYNKDANPAGYVDLSVAENRLSLPLVAQALNTKTPPLPVSFLTYDIMVGSLRMRDALASFFTRFITHTPVQPNHLAVTAGAGSTVDLLVSAVCDPGDKVLITAPAYAGFVTDVETRTNATAVIAELDEENAFQVTPHGLERAWAAHGGLASGIRAVLLSSPGNPTGEVLSADTIRSIVHWTQQNDLHLIMDEIYALSVFSAATSFRSVAEVLEGRLGNHVHIVWSFSKDFCISGCRVGVLYSQNAALLRAFGGLAYFASTSRQTQWSLLHLLEDADWVEGYIQESQRRLGAGYAKASESFQALGVPHITSHAGFFLLVDLRQWMTAPTAEAEDALWRLLVDGKVLLTPAGQMFSSNYGWFRCCFSAVTENALEVGMQRIRAVLNDIRPFSAA